MKKGLISFSMLLLFIIFSSQAFGQQPADGENQYKLAAVNPRFLGADTLEQSVGRGIWVAHDPDLDNDGKPEIIITKYWRGGRVLVFEMVDDNKMEFVWASKPLEENSSGGGSTPRSVTVGDFDNNGRQEIVFQVGYNPNDSTDAANRGIYFYEWTGEDNDYGTEPIYKLKFEDIDTNFKEVSVGRTENGMRIQDIDGDGKNEFLFPPRAFNFKVAKLYIMEVASGTFADGNASIKNEYVYEDMVNAIPPVDGYVPCGTEIGDVDNDGFDEIIVAGWTNIQAGAGLGFIQIDGPDSYTPGSIIPIADFSAFVVKAKPLFTMVNGNPVIYLHGTNAGTGESKMWVVEGIVADNFVDASNAKELMSGVGYWSAWALGDQDHPTNSAGDGLDLYLYGGGGRLLDIEYDGSGDVTQASSYSTTQIINLNDIYDNVGGLFNDVYTYPGMDLDNDGNRDLVASYKGSGVDSLNGELFARNAYHIFFFEWGDSTQSKDLVTSVPQLQPLTIITPEDYRLHQNYPNPFNPTTTIAFDLPLEKKISLKIFNTMGREIKTLIDNHVYQPGTHNIVWDGTDNNGNEVASGNYIYKLYFGNFSKSKIMSLIR